jgi:hypothetical protein
LVFEEAAHMQHQEARQAGDAEAAPPCGARCRGRVVGQ